MNEAQLLSQTGEIQRVEAAAIASGQVTQLPDGRAAARAGLRTSTAGDPVTWATEGVFRLAKVASEVHTPGDQVWWDASANKATMQHTGLGDFFVGVCVKASSATDTTVDVDLNVRPTYAIDLRQGEWTTEATLGLGVSALVGGAAQLAFDAVAEVAQAALLSARTVPVAAGPVLEALIDIVANGDAAAFDLNIGLADSSHASDADSIDEAVFVHIDGGSANINAESDDGTTEVAATDTTKDFTAGTPFWIKIDATDPDDVQIYINGALVLPDTVFKLTDATGPLLALVHMEKTSDDTTADVRVLELRVRAQAA